MAEGWNTWYDDAETFSESFGVGTRPRLLHDDLNRLSDQPLRDRLRSRLDVDFERLLDTAPPALAHRLGLVAAMAGHYRYSWPLLRAAAYAMPLGSVERHWALHNWRMAALEAHAWSSALESVQMLAREAPEEAPFPVERYLPVRMLGVGGFAEVYLCRSIANEELVVVKALARKPAHQWPRDVFHEVRLLKAAAAPGVPQVREFGYVDADAVHGPYCVLEYFDGLSLHQYVDACGPLTWTNLRPILLRVLDALEATHQAGVLHCDVKPGNILLRCDSQGWQTELIDFGIGVLASEQQQGTLTEERRPGTIGFSAPEQLGCTFATPVTPAVDVYALGQTALFALTGHPPGKCRSDQLTQVAGPLAEVLLNCIEHDPRQRPRVEQLRRFLQQLDTDHEPAHREDQTTRLPVEVAPLEPATGYGTVVVASEFPDASIVLPAAHFAAEPLTNGASYASSHGMDEGEDARLDCTVFAPPGLAQGDAALVQVFTHAPQHAAEVQRMAIGLDAAAPRMAFRGLDGPPMDSRQLLFSLVAPGLIIDEPIQRLAWRGQAESVQFGVTVPRDATPRAVMGTVQVTQDGAPLGCLRFRLQVLLPGGNSPTTPWASNKRLRRYRKAFACYSSLDRAEVLKRLQIFQRVDLSVFQDVPHSQSDDILVRELYQGIDECDLFLLFWSSAAQQSPWVAREFRYALDRRKREDLPEIVPVLLEGPAVPPPPELAHLHFHDEILHIPTPRPAHSQA